MSGLTGNSGITGSAAAPDLGALAALLSDPNALSASVKQFNDAKDAADAAVADSQVKVEQAKALAANIIADAQAEADKLLNEAKSNAHDLMTAAQNEVRDLSWVKEKAQQELESINATIDAVTKQQHLVDAEWKDGVNAREKAYSDAMASAAKREEAADILISDYKNRIADITARASALADAATIAVKGL